MTEEVKVFSLKINGIDSVKSLKQYISDLRDSLVNLDDKSEEYSQVVDELVASQKKLNTVMGASKESLKGSEGSYNALVNEMKALKTVWREVSDEASRNEIGSRIAEINNQLKDMDSSIGNHQRNVGNYEQAIANAFVTPQQELRKLKTELASMEQGTDEYNQTFQRMAELTHNVTEQQEMLRWSSADLGDILGNLAGVAAGLAGGFSAINAVQGLIGSGNEDVERAMQTTQNWIQLIQGLEAVESLGDKITGLWEGLKNYAQAQQKAAIETEKTNMSLASNVVQTNRAATATVGFTGGLNKAIVSVKTLALSIKTALVSSGIGLLIVALGTAVSYLWKFVDGTDKAEKASKKMEDANDKLNKSLEKSKEEWEYQEKLMKAQGKSYDEIYEAKKKALQQDLDQAKQTFKTNEATAKTIGLKNLEKEKYADVNAAYKESKEKVEELTKSLSDLDKERNIEKIKEETEARKKATEAYKQQKKAAEDLYNSLQDEKTQIENRYKEELEILRKGHLSKEQLADAEAKLSKKKQDELDKIELDALSKRYEEIRKINETYLGSFDEESEEYYNLQLTKAENYLDCLKQISKSSDIEEALKLFNLENGTNITKDGLSVEIKSAKKNVDDLIASFKTLQSSKVFDDLQGKSENLGSAMQQSLDGLQLKTDLNISDKKPLERAGLSKDEIKAEMEQRYGIQEQFINAELELWQNALDSKILIGEEEVEANKRVQDLLVQQQMLSTQKQIEQNDLRVESFRNAVDTMESIANSLGSIFGGLGDYLMEKAEAQREVGDITQEEYEKEFERAKKFQMAEVMISTITGAIASFNGIMKATGGWGIAAAIAQFAAVMANGIMQYNKIKAITPDKSNSDSSSSAKYAMATPSATSDFNPQLTQNATGQQETEDLANAIGKQNIWVSVTDIDNAQKQGRVRVSESSF